MRVARREGGIKQKRQGKNLEHESTRNTFWFYWTRKRICKEMNPVSLPTVLSPSQ